MTALLLQNICLTIKGLQQLPLQTMPTGQHRLKLDFNKVLAS